MQNNFRLHWFWHLKISWYPKRHYRIISPRKQFEVLIVNRKKSLKIYKESRRVTYIFSFEIKRPRVNFLSNKRHMTSKWLQGFSNSEPFVVGQWNSKSMVVDWFQPDLLLEAGWQQGFFNEAGREGNQVFVRTFHFPWKKYYITQTN